MAAGHQRCPALTISPGTPCSKTHDVAIDKRWHFFEKSLGRASLSRVLDAGCGYGIYSQRLSKFASQIIAVDISRSNLEAARAIVPQQVELVQGTVDRLPLSRGALDAIICIETLEHVLDYKQAIREFHRVLRAGGRLVVTGPNRLCPWQFHLALKTGNKLGLSPLRRLRFINPKRRGVVALAYEWTPQELRHIFIEAGFRVNRMEFLMPTLEWMGRDSPLAKLIFWLLRTTSQISERVPLLRNLAPFILFCCEKGLSHPDSTPEAKYK